MTGSETLIAAHGLSVEFKIGGGLFSRRRTLGAVRAVTLDIRRGEVLAIVGETGCGKTTLARTLLGLQTPTAGEVLFDGEPLSGLDRRSIARFVQPVFQDPYSSLNPRKTIASIIALPLIVHGGTTAEERRARVTEIMERVGLSSRLIHSYPSQLSGGQRQRVAIARALIAQPRLVVCDEPTSALDVSVQAQILNLLQDLRLEFDLTYVFISHDLSVVQHIADRIAVMYLGRIVEIGPAAEVFGQARHPYTAMLLSSALPPDPDHRLPEIAWDGGYPDPTDPPSGCHFNPRCPQAMERCRAHAPMPVRVSRSDVACHLYSDAQTAVA
jgi:peptide/nickel transport system ATP-binding protein